MRLLFVAMVLIFTLETALAGTEDPPAERTSSVTEMLQRRHEHQMREQLVKEGRWEEVREMDEEQLRRQQVQTKQTLTKVNAELAREGTVDTPVNGDGVFGFCAPVRAPGKLGAQKIKPDSVSGGTDSSNVR